MKFDSTSLPQTNEPKEIQKAILDLLDKINKVQTALDALPVQKVYAPLPQVAAGVGQWIDVENAASVTLNAGGTWVYSLLAYNAATGACNTVNSVGGFAAGGTIVAPAAAGFVYKGWCWRIT